MTAQRAAPAVGLHLFRVDARRVPRALWRMAADRRRLRALEGLRFAKLLGTGDGRTFDLRDADLRTWGILGVWDSAADRRAFASSSVGRAWRAIAAEQWSVDLLPLRSSGAWSRRHPFEPVADAPDPAGPVAAITRARLRPRRAVEFWRAVPPVTAELHRAPGLLWTVGIGEAPIGLQGTFSLWRDEHSLRSFAYGGAHHRDAIRRTHRREWYAEDLFARFAVTGTSGTFRGRDPADH